MFFSLRSPIFLLIASLLFVTVKLPEGAAMDSGGSSNTPSNDVTVNYSPAAPFVDTDGDSYSDDAERAFGTSPEDPASIPDHRPVHTQPNLVIIYADDMGFGDVAAYGDLYGTTSPAPTPRMDQLASEGVMFTRAHSSNAVCTPSRYALLTGKYNWREFNGITASWGGERGGTIPRYSDVTIAEFLKTQGYDTAAFGKWHMSGSWYLRDGVTNARGASDPATVDWARPVEDHATAHGFDYFRGLATSINFGPYVYLADDRNQFWDAALNGGQGGYRDATNDDPFVMLTSSQIAEGVVGSRSGGDNLGDPSYRQIQAGPLMISQVEEYLAGRADVDDPDPFFAYVALYSPHTPVAPTEPFQGLTGYPYGDFVAEVDHRIGRVLDALEANGFGENTVVVLTSDNGPETFAMSGLSRGKDSNGPLRGVKRDAWEGGTRVPFIVRWPGQAAPGLISNDLIWQGDIFATIAAFLGVELPDDVAPDGESFLNLLHGQQKPEPQRGSVIPASMYGHLSFNTVDGWKLIDSTGGGGNSTSWDADNNKITNAQGTNQGEPKQLYQLTTDIGERENLIAGVTGDGAIRAEITARTGRDLLDLLDQYRLHPSTHFYERTPDNDADGMSNDFETTYQFDRDWPLDAGEDADSDSVTNLREAQNDLDPRDEDTDGDKLLDGEELDRIGSLPDDPHSDGDSLDDGQEVLVYDTNPLLRDTDGDGIDDDVELANFSNPRNADVTPPSSGAEVTTALDPVAVQLVGLNGNVNDPAVQGGAGWPEAGTHYIRERDGNDPERRTRLFLRFDLGGITGAITSARLRIHQNHRLNSSLSADLEMARVTEPWEAAAGSFPLFSGTAVADTFLFGNNSDFGAAPDAAGFFSGTPGVAGADDAGFDPGGSVTQMVRDWHNGVTANHGIRVAFADTAYVGSAFSSQDDPGTPDLNEKLQLLVTSQSGVESLDADGDGMLDSQEEDVFGTLSRDGTGDYDGDGASDWFELALGSNARDAASLPALTLLLSQDNPGLAFRRHLRAGLGYKLLASEDLVNWEPALRYFEYAADQPPLEAGADYEVIHLTPRQQLPERIFIIAEPHIFTP